MKPQTTTYVGLRVPSELLTKADAIADEKGLSRSEFMRMALIAFVEDGEEEA